MEDGKTTEEGKSSIMYRDDDLVDDNTPSYPKEGRQAEEREGKKNYGKIRDGERREGKENHVEQEDPSRISFQTQLCLQRIKSRSRSGQPHGSAPHYTKPHHITPHLLAPRRPQLGNRFLGYR